MTTRIIEFIQNIKNPSGASVAELGSLQFLIPVFPGGTGLYMEIAPPEGVYAWIVFDVSLNPVMIPDVITIQATHLGRELFNGVITEAILAIGFPSYSVVTTAQPYNTNVVNTGALPQYLEGTILFLRVDTADEMKYILARIADVNLDGFVDLARDVSALLTAAGQQLGTAPRAPATGGTS